MPYEQPIEHITQGRIDDINNLYRNNATIPEGDFDVEKTKIINEGAHRVHEIDSRKEKPRYDDEPTIFLASISKVSLTAIFRKIADKAKITHVDTPIELVGEMLRRNLDDRILNNHEYEPLFAIDNNFYTIIFLL